MISRTKNLWTFVIAYTVVLILFMAANWRTIFQQSTSVLPLGTTSAASEESAANRRPSNATNKRILFWNSFFYSADFRFGYGHEPFLKFGCAVNACETTGDRNLLAGADAVLIHTPLVDRLPPRPTSHQRYVFVQAEPHMKNSDVFLRYMSGYFNMTMTYRQDSDIPMYYAYRKRSVAFAELVDVDPASRPKSVVWVVSHCDTPSRREIYVKELMKYIDVDVYGMCGSYKCPKKNNTYCRTMYEQTYRFYLSFENDVCKDYISEKLYHPLRLKIIPIVYGGADYRTVVPTQSVINIMDYPDPKDLASYLKYLGNNRTAYNEYFKWKRNGLWFDVNPRQRMATAMCKLCEILHNDSYVYRDYTDIRSWWVDGTCNYTVMDSMMARWRHRADQQ